MVFAFVFGGRLASSYYVDALWFGSLGFVDVFWKTLKLQSGVFTAFAAATFLVLYGTFLILKRAHIEDLPSGHTIFVGGQPLQLPVAAMMNPIALGLSLVIGAMTGAGLMAEWPTLALYWNAPHTAAGMVDPIFGRPLNFYLFTLPAWQLITGWLMMLAVLITAVAVFFVLITGGSRALGPERSLVRIESARALHRVFIFAADPGDAGLSRPLRAVV